MIRRPCAYLRASAAFARRDEEDIHTRLARADRLLLDPADRADLAVEEDLAGRRDLVPAVDVPSELLEHVEREGEPGRGAADAVRVDRDADRQVDRLVRVRGSRRRLPRFEPCPPATVVSGTTVAVPPRMTVKRNVVPIGLPAITLRDVGRACARACRRSRRSRRSARACSPPGSPARSRATSAPLSVVVTFLPSARSATAAATCCDGLHLGRR